MNSKTNVPAAFKEKIVSHKKWDLQLSHKKGTRIMNVISSLVIFSKDISSNVWCHPECGFQTVFILNMISLLSSYLTTCSPNLVNALILSSISVYMSIVYTWTWTFLHHMLTVVFYMLKKALF